MPEPPHIAVYVECLERRKPNRNRAPSRLRDGGRPVHAADRFIRAYQTS